MAYRLSGDFICRRAGREAVLLNAKTGDYFGLNEVGADYLELLDGVREAGEIVDKLCGLYDAPREVIERDIGNLAQTLLGHGILVEG